MAITIKPLLAEGEDPITGEPAEIDKGIDIIVLEEKGKCYELGYVARTKGANVSFIRPLSESQRKEALEVVAARECDDDSEERGVYQVTGVGE